MPSDPAWLDHHFTWERGGDGVDRLVERKHFTPLPYHGALSELDGGSHYYRIEKAGHALREALIAFLVTEFKAERAAADSDAYEVPVKIDGRVVNVAASSDFGYVAVSMERDSGGLEAGGQDRGAIQRRARDRQVRRAVREVNCGDPTVRPVASAPSCRPHC